MGEEEIKEKEESLTTTPDPMRTPCSSAIVENASIGHSSELHAPVTVSVPSAVAALPSIIVFPTNAAAAPA